MPKVPTMPCTKCHGKGAIPLSQPLTETLALMPAKRAATASELAAAVNMRVSAMAFNNRLEALRRLGLLEREKHGKSQLYRKISKPKQTEAKL